MLVTEQIFNRNMNDFWQKSTLKNRFFSLIIPKRSNRFT
jgi:hypothetical protein